MSLVKILTKETVSPFRISFKQNLFNRIGSWCLPPSWSTPYIYYFWWSASVLKWLKTKLINSSVQRDWNTFLNDSEFFFLPARSLKLDLKSTGKHCHKSYACCRIAKFLVQYNDICRTNCNVFKGISSCKKIWIDWMKKALEN